VEFALVQQDVLFGLKQGTEVLKAIHREMGGIEVVEKMMEDDAEARAYQEVRYPFLLIFFICGDFVGVIIISNWIYALFADWPAAFPGTVNNSGS